MNKGLGRPGVAAFVRRVRREARLRPQPVVLESLGQRRVFNVYDWGSDSFVFEKGAWSQLRKHLPVLLVRKSELGSRASGYVMTLTTGNHATAAIPLLSGSFWNLGRVPPDHRSRVLRECVVCANVVDGRIEVSQRDVPSKVVTDADEWLRSVGFALDEVVMAERNDETLGHYRRLGQEWRVKPLAWTPREMAAALASSRTRINSRLRYYHSVKGVHFLSYPEFRGLLRLFEEDSAAFVECLRELVSIFEDGTCSCMRLPKFHGHNEIELFGLRRGVACERIVPELERLMEGIALGTLAEGAVAARLEAIAATFKAQLERPALADEESEDFIETLYMHLTGEVYHGQGAAVMPAFDDRRTALPGATFRGGAPDFHPGADERTQVIIANLGQMVSRDESVEYVNIYELRSASDFTTHLAVGAGVTREIVFKTDRRPLRTSLIEKRLALKIPGYGSYMLARVEAFKALGVGFGEYRLLMRPAGAAGRQINYFIRNRCPGEPLDDIPVNFFRAADPGASGDDPEVVLKLGELLGDAAAQNMALKKYLPDTGDCRFGEGKEIFEFAFDIAAGREMPKRVMLCSIRGCFGWESLEFTDENLERSFDFYLESFAKVLYRYWLRHREAVSLRQLAGRFLDGFESKTREMHWNYTMRREQFDAFDPQLPKRYNFVKKWRFALWALGEQLKRMKRLRRLFAEKLALVAAKSARGAGGLR